MSEHVMGSLNASLAKKKAKKYSPELENDTRKWLSEQLNNEEFINPSVTVFSLLQNGVLLCELVKHNIYILKKKLTIIIL